MYRRSDPRWNRTLQHISENLEHANESAQENLYGFTQRYVNPCLASITQCANACTAPCFPAHSDRRRHRGRSQGRAELSFDFYDDWEDDESEGLLGWGSDNLDRFLGGASSYGATSTQPGRQRAMSYGQRNRDPRYNNTRRKSTTLPRDATQDPTVIPSSSYFGFLGRLPWKIGGKGLRYKPSAADLTDHPGTVRRSLGDEEPLIEESDEDAQSANEAKGHRGHRRQRSDTRTSGHTTDSLSSRGDIFPSEDELEDAVPLDDEFTIALERRTTGQWNSDTNSSNKARSSKSKRPSHVSTRTASSRITHDSARASHEDRAVQQSTSSTIEEASVLDDMQREEECLGIEQDLEIHRKRVEARQLAAKRGLTYEPQLPTSSTTSDTPRTPSPQLSAQMMSMRSTLSPLLPASSRATGPGFDIVPSPSFIESEAMPPSSCLHVQGAHDPSTVPISDSPQSNKVGIPNQATSASEHPHFVPARLPLFGAGLD